MKTRQRKVVLALLAILITGITRGTLMPIATAQDNTQTEAIFTATYDNNDVRNDEYFKAERQMTLTIKDKDYDENNLRLEIEINGNSGEYTLEQIRNGQVKDVKIEKDREDTEANKEAENYTEERINTYTLVYTSETSEGSNRFKINANYTKTGEKINVEFKASDKAVKEFVIDKTLPIISSIYKNASGIEVKESIDRDAPIYDTEKMDIILQIEETNFNPKDAKIDIISRNSQGVEDKETTKKLQEKIKTAPWSKDGQKNILTLSEITIDGNYEILIECKDLAGNIANSYDPRYITIDKSSPSGKIHLIENGEEKEYSQIVTDAELQNRLKKFTYNYFSKDNLAFTGKYIDETSGILKKEYCILDVSQESTENFDLVMNLNKMNWINYEDEPIEIQADSNVVIFQRIEDKAGNITYTASNGAIIVDNKSPDKPIAINITPQEKIYNKDIEIEISANDTDKEKKDLYSGIKSLSYEVYNTANKSVTQIGVIKAPTSKTKTLKDEIVLEKEKNNANDVELRLRATDYAGNIAENTYHYAVDATIPKINVALDRSDEKNEYYFNKTKTASVTFEERNFEDEKATISLSINGKKREFTLKALEQGDAAKEGINVSKVSDNQKEYQEKDRTDERQITYDIQFGCTYDAEFTYDNIKINCTDAAGNTGATQELKKIIIDKIAPAINVSYKEAGLDITKYIHTDKTTPIYSQKSITPTITIKDEDFKKENVQIKLTQTNSKGESIKAYTEEEIKEKKWNKNKDNHSVTLDEFKEDANYSLGITYEDKAGNMATAYEPHYFTIDKTVPFGSIEVITEEGATTYNEFVSESSFEHISKNKVIVKENTGDDTSGVMSVQYYIYDPGKEIRNTFKLPTLKALKKVNWEDWKDKDIYIEPDSQAIVYAKIEDRAGNIAYINTKGGIIADHTEPFRPEINIETSNPENGIYASSVEMKIHVEENTNKRTYAGLKKATLEVFNKGELTQKVEKEIGSKQAREKAFDTNLVVNPAKNNSNHVLVRVTTTDWAGNTASSEKEIAIDVVTPKIEVTYDNNEPTNNHYYNTKRTATIKVYERNFDPQKTNINITGGTAQIGEWHIGLENGESDSNINTSTVVFNNDAEYSFTMDTTDKAGNKSVYDKTDTFVIDQTAPVIKISFDKVLQNGKYINTPRIASVEINERNFRENDVVANITAFLQGSKIAPPTISNWKSEGDNHAGSIAFNEDGDYKVTLDYTDLAGNKATTLTDNEFTVDKTPPVINFSGVEDNSANRKAVQPETTFSDINYDKNLVHITLKGYRHDEKSISEIYKDIENGGQITLNDFEYDEKADDIYTLETSIEDKAGNIAKKQLTFSVNRFGSNYYFSKETEAYLKDFYHNKEQDIVLHEINTDELKTKEVIVLKDSISYQSSQNSKIEELVSGSSWKEYKYTINAKEFEKEGYYEITVNSEDKAGNKQNNKIKEKPVFFIIDKTPPSIQITGIEDKSIYKEKKREVTINVEDNGLPEKVDISIDNIPVKSFNAKEIVKANGKLKYTLTETPRWQRIEASGVDAAGNKSNAVSSKVLITSNRFAHAIHHWSTKGIIAIGLIFVNILLARKLTKLTKGKNKTL